MIRRDYTIKKIFCFTLSYVNNKQGDDPSGVTFLLEAKNVFSINRIIISLETDWSAETQRSW